MQTLDFNSAEVANAIAALLNQSDGKEPLRDKVQLLTFLTWSVLDGNGMVMSESPKADVSGLYFKNARERLSTRSGQEAIDRLNQSAPDVLNTAKAILSHFGTYTLPRLNEYIRKSPTVKAVLEKNGIKLQPKAQKIHHYS